MIVRYVGKTCLSLINGNEYEVIRIENGMYRIKDETDDDYLFSKADFEIVDNSNPPEEIEIE